MSESHVAREALEAYVIGALDEAEAARLESHVLACPACEARLQHEASLELAFTQVARAPEARPRRAGRVAAPIAAVGGVLAVAAAMILWLGAHGDVDARAPAAEAPTTIPTRPPTRRPPPRSSTSPATAPCGRPCATD